MTFLYSSPLFREHFTGSHPEHPRRLAAIEARLDQTGLSKQCVLPQWLPASREQLERVHDPHYVEHIQRYAAAGGGRIEADTVLSSRSYDVATLAVGAACDAVRRVVKTDDSTALCLVIGFPVALYIARADARWKNLLLNLIMLPFWTSFLVRTYAWMFLLRDTGLINSSLMAMGVISEPLPLLYNETAVIIGLVYGYLPFAVLPLFSNLDRLDKNLLAAAADLGATPWQAFRRVTLPLIAPSMVAGWLVAFTLSIDDFVITFFTAGVGVTTLPLQIYSMIKVAVSPEVNAVSTLLMALTLSLVALASRLAPHLLRGRP